MTTVGTKENSTDAESASNVVGVVNLGLEAAHARLQLAGVEGLSLLSVRWGQTVNTGNYSSVRLDAEAVVPMGTSAESTLEALVQWVRSQLPFSDAEVQDAVYETRALKQELADLKDRADHARRQWERILGFLQANNIPVPRPVSEDLPF